MAKNKKRLSPKKAALAALRKLYEPYVDLTLDLAVLGSALSREGKERQQAIEALWGKIKVQQDFLCAASGAAAVALAIGISQDELDALNKLILGERKIKRGRWVESHTMTVAVPAKKRRKGFQSRIELTTDMVIARGSRKAALKEARAKYNKSSHKK